ncbi:hypothetical protein ACXO2R_02295 [Lactobacillus delbrueckii subsp. bulgaricus]
MLRKYYVTIVFTLLALLNLLSSWGTLQYRLVMLAFNLVCGFSMEYLVNKKAPAEKYICGRDARQLFCWQSTCFGFF